MNKRNRSKAAQPGDYYLDCIAMKRAIQRKDDAAVRRMTPEERVAYYHTQTEKGPFAALLKGINVVRSRARRQ